MQCITFKLIYFKIYSLCSALPMDFLPQNIAYTNTGQIQTNDSFFYTGSCSISSISYPFHLLLHELYIFKATHKINFLIQIPQMNPPRNEFPSPPIQLPTKLFPFVMFVFLASNLLHSVVFLH